MMVLGGRLFFNNFIMKAAINDEKALTDKLQIDISGTIYTQKLGYRSGHANTGHTNNVNGMTFSNLKNRFI